MFNKNESAELKCADPVDFRKIYNSTFELLFKISVKIVLDEEAAEDLVHDSYIKFEKNDQYIVDENGNTTGYNNFFIY